MLDSPLSGAHISARTEMRPAIIAAGAGAFVSKTDPPERILEAIQKVSSLTHEAAQGLCRIEQGVNDVQQ